VKTNLKLWDVCVSGFPSSGGEVELEFHTVKGVDREHAAKVARVLFGDEFALKISENPAAPCDRRVLVLAVEAWVASDAEFQPLVQKALAEFVAAGACAERFTATNCCEIVALHTFLPVSKIGPGYP
jgi:hypothetical protein